MIITLLVDNPKSWYYKYGKDLMRMLVDKGHTATLVHTTEGIPHGDIALFLSCEKIIKKDIRDRNTHNLVVHSSPLPQGKGWSPLTWAILEGKNDVTNTLFEAVDAVDAGVIYGQNVMHFEGHELLDELHHVQGEAINTLVLQFVDQYPHIIGKKQEGEESFYERRLAEDSQLDPEKTIAEQFNLLRIVDNEQYPAFFWHRGKKYIVKMYKAEE